jgi:GH15 family glucan-1,4-alpha-glucosidase
MRDTSEDDFGRPETAFLVRNFLYIDALAATGGRDEERALFTDLLERRNSFGLLSEDVHPETGEPTSHRPIRWRVSSI